MHLAFLLSVTAKSPVTWWHRLDRAKMPAVLPAASAHVHTAAKEIKSWYYDENSFDLMTS